jgi:MFS family permease
VSAVALGTVPAYPFIVLLRFLQGLGAAAAAIGGGVALYAAAAARVGHRIYAGITTLSPSVAGWFIEYLSWKVIFWQNIGRADRNRLHYDRVASRAIAA